MSGGKVKLTPPQLRMLIELLPFHLPKLSAVGVGYMTNNTFAERLDRAIDRSERAKLIEGRAIEVTTNRKSARTIADEGGRLEFQSLRS